MVSSTTVYYKMVGKHSYLPHNEALEGTISPDLCEPWSNGNEGVLYILQSLPDTV